MLFITNVSKEAREHTEPLPGRGQAGAGQRVEKVIPAEALSELSPNRNQQGKEGREGCLAPVGCRLAPTIGRICATRMGKYRTSRLFLFFLFWELAYQGIPGAPGLRGFEKMGCGYNKVEMQNVGEGTGQR